MLDFDDLDRGKVYSLYWEDMKGTRLNDPKNFFNRELSQLEFIRRVFAQAEDTHVSLLERLKFLCISSEILDEFFEIRVSGSVSYTHLTLPTTPYE